MPTSSDVTKIDAGSVITKPLIQSVQDAYVLDETTFRLIKKPDTIRDSAIKVFFIFLGSLFTLGAKYFEKLTSNNPTIDYSQAWKKWEVYLCIISLLAFSVLMIISCFGNSERKDRVTTIETHFKNNPPTTAIK